MKYNHNSNLESFSNEIKLIKSHGFNLIGVSQLYFEDVFIFETNDDAKSAFEILEKNNKEISGYWYSKEEFEIEVLNYENVYTDTKVLIYWL